MDVIGKVVAITGSLWPMTRIEVTAFLVERGAEVLPYVCKRTDVLIVGRRQLDLFHIENVSKKYSKALALREQGQPIELVSEEEFFKFVEESQK